MRGRWNLWSRLDVSQRLALIALLVVSLAWLSVGAYQSHFQLGRGLLGDTAPTSIHGAPKEGRGDEWSTYIPILKQAYLEGFPKASTLEPYKENLKWFLHVPRSDWSLVFLPNQLAYWALPGPLALSIQGLYYNVLFLLSFVWLLRNLGVRSVIAIPAAVALLFSHFYQVWWTSNFPSLGASLLPLAILSSRLPRLWKFPLLSYAIAHMLFGQMYPAFYYAAAFAVLPIIFLIRADLFNLKDLFGAAIAAGVACLLYLAYDISYIDAVSGTTYPGMRVSTGGGSSWSTLLGLLLPTVSARAASDAGLTFYELSVAGTILPLLGMLAIFSMKSDREDLKILLGSALIIVFSCLFSIYAFVPEQFAKATGLFLVPGRRMQLGVSLSVTILSCVLLSRRMQRMWGIALLGVLLLAGVATYFIGERSDNLGQIAGLRYYFLLASIFCAAGVVADVVVKAKGERVKSYGIVLPLWGMAIFHVFAYGSFNPLIRAADILEPVRTQVTRDWVALYKYNNGKAFAVSGNYGHLLRGEGLPAYEAIHLKNVYDDVYASIFPELSYEDRERLFNQFRGVRFSNRFDVDFSGLTAVLPLMPYGVKVPIKAEKAPSSFRVVTAESSIDAVRTISPDRFEVLWSSKLISGMPVEAAFTATAECTIEDIAAVRYPVDSGPDSGRVSARGISGSALLSVSGEGDAEACVKSLRLHSSDVLVGKRVSQLHSVDSNWRRAASWTGKPCDLSGPARLVATGGGVIELDGYVVDPSDEPAGDFRIVFSTEGASYYLSAATGQSRPDVAEYFNNALLQHSGFNATIDTSQLPVGSYKVEFALGSEMHEFCDTGKSIVVE